MQRTRTLAIGIIAMAILFAGSTEVRADDTALFTTSVPPNVLFIFDNSGSMNNIVWHPEFEAGAIYQGDAGENCTFIADPTDPDWDELCLEFELCSDAPARGVAADVSADYCGITRTLYTDPEQPISCGFFGCATEDTDWDKPYMEWYFSENVEQDYYGDGASPAQEIATNNNGERSACLIFEGKPQFYNKYKRTRITAAKTIVREVLCNTDQVADIRYGLMRFYDSGFGSDPDGGWLIAEVKDYDSTHAAEIEAKISALDAQTYTPLAETLWNAYRYFMDRDASKTVIGRDGTTRAPPYDIDLNGTDPGAAPPVNPVQDPTCQQNFVILITDGEPTRDTFEDMPDFTQAEWIANYVGDYNNPGDETETDGLWLDDVAAYMQQEDLFPETSARERIDVYTVGFTTSPVANDLLARTAEAGNGKFFYSNNAEDLTIAITATINDIVTKSKAFTAATVPASRATDGNNFFTSYFNPSKEGPFWQGHLKLFEFNAAGEIRDKPVPPDTVGECALDDPNAPASCATGALKLSLDGFWDAGTVMPTAANRDLYVSMRISGNQTLIDFKVNDPQTIEADDIGLGSITVSDISSYDIGLATHDVSGISTVAELVDAIVDYIRGCNLQAGSCVDRGATQKLWDIFHSNPVVVGSPNAGINEATYRDFVGKYRTRKRVIYAGSNGGFVHGFNAGEYNHTVTNGYDRGDGVEEFGFMSYAARQRIGLLPKDTPPRSEYFHDGSPSAADVWIYPNATDDPNDGSWNDWRTVLMGGMRQGGEIIWALDVTNPPDHNSASGEQPTGPAYPSYLWEFPAEDSSGDAYRPFMGETWSQPVITRIKVTIDCDSGCAKYDRWVAIFGTGYHDSGDPNLPHENVAGDVNPGEYDASNNSNTSTKGRAIVMIDIKTGEVLGMKHFQHNGTTNDPADGEPLMRFALASMPSVFDLDHDGYGDVIYIGDLGGQLWKWVIHEPGQDHLNGSQGDENQARWPFVRMMQAWNCTDTGGGATATAADDCVVPHYKSIFFPPTGALVGPNLWLAWGTGERDLLNYGQDGVTKQAEKNRFYVMKDTDPFERERIAASVLPYDDIPEAGDSAFEDGDFLDVTGISGTDPNTCLGNFVGYFIEGEAGEKFITDSVIFFGVVLAGSYVPPPSGAAACSTAGSAFLYGFDLLCGGGIFDGANPGDPKERRISIGAGIPNAPRVSVGPLGGGGGGGACQDMVVVITSEGEGFTECPGGRPNSGLRIRAWREL